MARPLYCTLLTVTGNATIGTLGVSGAATLPAITGPTTLTGLLSVTGDIQWANNSGFGLVGSDSVRFLTYTSATGLTTVPLTVGGSAPTMLVNDTRSAAVHQSGLLQFGANRTTGGGTIFAQVSSDPTNISNASYAGDLVFATSTGGVLAEHLRVTGAGLLQGLNSASFVLSQNAPLFVDLSNPSAGSSAYVTFNADSNAGEIAIRSYSSTFNAFTHAGIALAGMTEVWTAVALGQTGMLIGTDSNVPLIFATNNSEKARLFGSGGFALGDSVDPGANWFIVGKIGGGAYGTGVAGPFTGVGYNSSGVGCGGQLFLQSKNGGLNFLWVDASASPGVLRIKQLPIVEGGTNDISGTIVGTQTSTLDTKDVLGEIGGGVSAADALAALVAAPVSKFTKKGGVEVFDGLIIDYSPWAGFDPDDRHPFGRSFSEVNFAGYATRAIQALAAKVAALEAKVG